MGGGKSCRLGRRSPPPPPGESVLAFLRGPDESWGLPLPLGLRRRGCLGLELLVGRWPISFAATCAFLSVRAARLRAGGIGFGRAPSPNRVRPWRGLTPPTREVLPWLIFTRAVETLCKPSPQQSILLRRQQKVPPCSSRLSSCALPVGGHRRCQTAPVRETLTCGGACIKR